MDLDRVDRVWLRQHSENPDSYAGMEPNTETRQDVPSLQAVHAAGGAAMMGTGDQSSNPI